MAHDPYGCWVLSRYLSPINPDTFTRQWERVSFQSLLPRFC